VKNLKNLGLRYAIVKPLVHYGDKLLDLICGDDGLFRNSVKIGVHVCLVLGRNRKPDLWSDVGFDG
jgi:hypothetical protein